MPGLRFAPWNTKPRFPARSWTESTFKSRVPAVSPWDLADVKKGESSEDIRRRVLAARKIQKQRFIAAGLPELNTNSELKGAALERLTELDDDAQKLLIAFAEKNQLSAPGISPHNPACKNDCRLAK